MKAKCYPRVSVIPGNWSVVRKTLFFKRCDFKRGVFASNPGRSKGRPVHIYLCPVEVYFNVSTSSPKLCYGVDSDQFLKASGFIISIYLLGILSEKHTEVFYLVNTGYAPVLSM